MKRIKIEDLTAQLSAHIQAVKDGEELLVCEGDKPVARIVRFDVENYSEQEQRLIAKGVLTPPRERTSARKRWPRPAGNVSAEAMERVWKWMRED